MNLKEQLIEWADKYEVPEFIQTDPIQFPHRFKKKQDIEISAFLTCYLAFGKREVIIRKVNELHSVMEGAPYEYIKKGDFSYFPDSSRKFYRFISYGDFLLLLKTLRSYYKEYEDLEQAVLAENAEDPIKALQSLFGHIHYLPDLTSTSACKRISMFLRWVCRQNSCVDLGIWNSMDTSSLLIPLDTHVHKMSQMLGITKRKSADFTTALEIKNYFMEVFPDDPGRGDFSLFGYAVNHRDYFKT